jgi:hypothetical protein
MAEVPMTYLEKASIQAKGKRVWPQSSELDLFKTDQQGLYVARGRLRLAIVVSHSCELDDKPDVRRVLIAPISPLSQVEDADARTRILERKRRAFMPLPGVPGIGDHYADLRCITYVDRKLITESRRKSSMTDEGVVALQAQLIAYLTRLDPDLVAGALAAGMARQNDAD